MEDKVHAFYMKLPVWQGRVKSGIWQHFLQWWIYLTTMIGTSRLLELKPLLRNTRGICHSNSCHVTHSRQKTQMVEMSGYFRHLVWMLSLKIKSRMIYKIT
jgi:hypothetical protein